MAKAATKTTTTKKAAAAPKVKVAFGKWVKEVARARGEIGEAVKAARDNAALKANMTIDKAREVLGASTVDALAPRYNGFLRRGFQGKTAAAA